LARRLALRGRYLAFVRSGASLPAEAVDQAELEAVLDEYQAWQVAASYACWAANG